MKIQSSSNHQVKTLNTPKTAATGAPEPSDHFLQSYGVEMGVGAFMGVMGAVPVMGAISNWNVSSSLLQYKEYGRGLSAFEMTGGLVAGGAALANLAGTVALFQGNGPLALALLGGGGIVTGSIAALAMDGGSLASRLGLQK